MAILFWTFLLGFVPFFLGFRKANPRRRPGLKYTVKPSMFHRLKGRSKPLPSPSEHVFLILLLYSYNLMFFIHSILLFLFIYSNIYIYIL